MSLLFVASRDKRRKPKKDSDDEASNESESESVSEEQEQEQPKSNNPFLHTKEENDRINQQIGIKPFLIMGGIIIILIGLTIGMYYLYDAIINKKILLSCPDFNKKGAGIVPTYCGKNREFYGSTCVKACPDGYNHTALCTCKKGTTISDCSIYNKETSTPTKCVAGMDYYGSTCVKGCPSGWKRTAACTCETGETITDCADSHAPTKCPAGRQFYGGMCYLACPENWNRTAACTCKSGSTETNCDLYGQSYVPTKCPSGRDYYGSACYNPCPSGQTRSAACTCAGGEAITDCPAYGLQQPYQCKDGKINISGLCYVQCPYGGARTAPCTCDFGGEGVADTKPYTTSCPDGYPYHIGPNCYQPSGELTSDVYFNGGSGSSPAYCPSDRILVGTSCLLPCPTVNGVSGTRVNYYTCQYPGDVSSKACVQAQDMCSDPRWPLYNPAGVGYCCAPAGPLDFQCPGGTICSDEVAPTCGPDLTNYPASIALCYFKCPAGATRTERIVCDFGGDQISTPEQKNCPDGYPIYYSSACHEVAKLQTSCDALSGGPPTIPDSCPSYQESYASACYGKCSQGYGRSALCTCTNYGFATNCSMYGNAKIPGDPLGPQCEWGDEMLASLCYKGACPGEMKRTAACTCSDERVETSCEIYGDAKGIGDPLGPQCEDNEDLYGGLCYRKCPEGMTRTAACTCSSYQLVTNCTLYGDPKGIDDILGPQCNFDEEKFGGLCYKQKCPDGMARTAACTCSNEDTITDCDNQGDPIAAGDPSGLGPQCYPDYDESGGLCYQDKCPDGYFRTGACSCQKN